mmetsp:Transcript_12507/g.22112  ORF Transcript_12507/g.22112 Transcript_12507/m.22112 type:complete len:192 (+) Transcript_12507:85-660(+)|eukprot:CAMPEP_0119108760 /NCGR_PEP_ID=MMETSP1180-20130426/15644_1 /TAXON_ID=3052 ORGANISM="Chlamydomonas cf sp, Strain CCMP681" /NCGR_SAMPLE_ID=MMETSP1180 /ASSEMBLY_ACC=CAM_ASM_000741 /LENGTH=191 /DNA_ID=CAMNT_0007094413 /DNA_START=1 /DNA_END=576 /DNA_ORIENTATION=+
MGNILCPASDSGHKYQTGAAGGNLPDAEQLRAAADSEFKARNAAFEESRNAYQNGDGAGAKKLSDAGKRHDEEAKRLQKAAADVTFQQKNAGRSEDEVDLHGLTVKEATARVEQALRSAKEKGLKSVVIITGRGNHSGPEGPKIKPAVEKLIHELSLRCTVNKPNEGCIFVELGVPEQERGWFGCPSCTIM